MMKDKSPYRIPRESPKHRAERIAFSKANGSWEGPCEIKSPVCGGRSEGWHHPLKKSQGGNHKTTRGVRSCNRCNGYVETHREWAEERGLVVSGHRFIGHDYKAAV